MKFNKNISAFGKTTKGVQCSPIALEIEIETTCSDKNLDGFKILIQNTEKRRRRRRGRRRGKVKGTK